MRALFDTNILIDLAAGHEDARRVVRSHRSPFISIITRIELLAGPMKTVGPVREMLDGFETIQIDNDIAEAAVVIRREVRLKLPDAVILATARKRDLPLITRNTKDFEGRDGVVIPYRL